jgi:hypothetical protein
VVGSIGMKMEIVGRAGGGTAHGRGDSVFDTSISAPAISREGFARRAMLTACFVISRLVAASVMKWIMMRGSARFAVRFYFLPLLEHGEELRGYKRLGVDEHTKRHNLHGLHGIQAPAARSALIFWHEGRGQGYEPGVGVTSAATLHTRLFGVFE